MKKDKKTRSLELFKANSKELKKMQRIGEKIKIVNKEKHKCL